MNRLLLTQLRRLTNRVSAQEQPVFLRCLFADIFNLANPYQHNARYQAFKAKALPLLNACPIGPEGTPNALTPEIFSLLHEQNVSGRKHQGIFYTPWALADLLAKETLLTLLTHQAKLDSSLAHNLIDNNDFTLTDDSLTDFLSRLSVCDPSAGSGGLLLPFALQLAKLRKKLNPSLTMGDILTDIFARNLYGADLDNDALTIFQERAYLLVRHFKPIGAYHPLLPHLHPVNALDTCNSQPALRKYYPQGFDVILANPPFIGQKNNASLFRNLKQNTFWKDKITPKGDLLYLFFYLALDLLHEQGCAGFITTPYFTTSSGAYALRNTLKEKASFLRLIDFGNTHLFPQAGQHTLLSIFQKNNPNALCRVGTTPLTLPQAQLYTGPDNYIQTALPAAPAIRRLLANMNACPRKLADVATISNGLMSGCDKITRAHLKRFPHLRASKGEGVFVLCAQEVHDLHLLPVEKEKLKPFFKNSDIDAFTANHTPGHYLIDIFYPKDRGLDWTKYPHLWAHLSRFKPVLLARKQNNNGIDKALAKGEFWYGSVRRRMNFDGEKILIPHRAGTNKFAYSNTPWYASSDVYFITSPKNNLSLWYLLALFNTKPYGLWLKYYGKRKGNLFELYTAPLRQLPVPHTDKTTQHRLEHLARQIYRAKQQGLSTAALENTLNAQVCALFGLNKTQTSRISAF